MIERYAGLMQLVCECGFAQNRTYDVDDFGVMIADARSEGWAITKPGGEWQHACPSCRGAARRLRGGVLL